METDGTEVDENEILEHYVLESAVFIILRSDEFWQPAFAQIQTVHMEEPQNHSNSTTQEDSSINITSNTFPIDYTNSSKGLSYPSLIEMKSIQITTSSSEPSTSNNSPSSNSTTYNTASTSQAENDSPNTPNSIDNIVEQTSTSKKLSSYDRKLLFSNYSFDFKKIPSFISNELEAGRTLNASLQHDLVHHVVKDLRQISESITMETFRSVAKDISQRYPKAFSIMDKNEKILDIDSITFASSLLNHHQYLNRGLKRKYNDDDIKPKNYRKMLNLSSGVDNFYADLPEDTSELENMRLWLREHADIKILSAEESAFELDYFEKTYALQRKFLNNFTNPPTIIQIKSEWPHLLKNKFLLNHFDKLFENINTSQFPSEISRLADTIIRKSKYNAENQTMSKVFTALLAIASKFNENIDVILKKYPVIYKRLTLISSVNYFLIFLGRVTDQQCNTYFKSTVHSSIW